jgi:hypothetical protein
MAIAGMQWGWLWARYFDDYHSHSVTVQVLNRDVVADIGLYAEWVGGSDHNSVVGCITQIVSDSGVENFPATATNESSVPTIFRTNVTSVTFTVRVYKAHGMARWMIYDWV